jgi:acyl-CoA synthetase (AMP-forming)/AMP-acid ligase II
VFLHSFLDYWAREQPNAEFAVQGQQQMTYRQALAAANRLANAFVNAGLRVGDRVALLSKNRIEYVLLYYAASKAGVVLVPLNYRLSPPQWTAIIGDAQARMLIAGGEYVEVGETIRGDLNPVEHFVSLDPTSAPGWQEYAGWVADQPSAAPDLQLDPDGELYQMYTSGTTGLPKGAVLSQRNLAVNLMQIWGAYRGQPGQRSLVVLPLFHAATVPSVFAPLSWGGALYIMEQFNPTEMVRILSQERIGFASLVPAVLQACLLAVPDVAKYRYEHLQMIYYGASPITEQTLRRAMQVFPCEFIQSYGLTEATQTITFLLPADHRRALSGQPELLLSAGRPVVGTELRIVDQDGNPLPNGALGEIIIRGPQLMAGYWNRPAETAATLRGGWLHTGDVGMLDGEGYLYIRDRLTDMILSGGENVYPNVVENVLARHPAVAEVAVIGVPDERWGETVKAIVVLRPGATATEADLIEFCRGQLAGFERPHSVDFIEALPRTPTGKVLKRVLRESYWAGQSRRVGGV